MKKSKFLARAAALSAAFFASVCGLGSAYVWQHTPERLSVTEDSGIEVPFTGIQARYTGQEEQSVFGEKGATTQVEYSFLGIVPVKTVTAEKQEQPMVETGGEPFGMRMLTSGVTVVEISEVMSGGAVCRPGEEAGLQAGDVIEKVNGETLEGSDDFITRIQQSAGAPVTLTFDRGGETKETTLSAVCSDSDGKWRCGLWVRDSTAGIGTVTFVDEESGLFAGLGHGVCSSETGELLPLSKGDVLRVTISGVIPGAVGAAGELRGYFSDDAACGELLKNTQTGMYGRLTGSLGDGETRPIAMRQQVHEGPATILVTTEGDTPKEYGIEIISVNYDESQRTRNLRLRVTDPELLEETGGIVQGFSGSPILQDGYLAGAVTHVLVNSPQEGYGIFAETMWEECEQLKKAG